MGLHKAERACLNPSANLLNATKVKLAKSHVRMEHYGSYPVFNLTNSLSLGSNVNHISRLPEACQRSFPTVLRLSTVLTYAPETDVKMSTEHGHWCHLLSTAQEHDRQWVVFFPHEEVGVTDATSGLDRKTGFQGWLQGSSLFSQTHSSTPPLYNLTKGVKSMNSAHAWWVCLFDICLVYIGRWLQHLRTFIGKWSVNLPLWMGKGDSSHLLKMYRVTRCQLMSHTEQQSRVVSSLIQYALHL